MFENAKLSICFCIYIYSGSAYVRQYSKIYKKSEVYPLYYCDFCTTIEEWTDGVFFFQAQPSLNGLGQSYCVTDVIVVGSLSNSLHQRNEPDLN